MNFRNFQKFSKRFLGSSGTLGDFVSDRERIPENSPSTLKSPSVPHDPQTRFEKFKKKNPKIMIFHDFA